MTGGDHKKLIDETLDRLPVNISFYDKDFRVLDMNQSQLKIFRVPDKNAIIGKTMSELNPEFDKSDRPAIYRKVLESGETTTVRSVLFNGVHVGVNVFRLKPGILGVCSMDVTRWVKEQEEAIRTLEKKNAQLEQFAYVASHDLQEPLRTLTSFVDLLNEEVGSQLSSEAMSYLGFIRGAAGRMETLIRDLLDYSRVGRIEPRPVDCLEALRQVLTDLEAEIERTGAKVTHGELPTVRFDPTLMTRLFQNLLTNALKFAKQGMAPAIRIEAKRGTDHWLFSVKDDGIGIDPQFHDRIFSLFQRLHSRTKYEGSGIGLSLCKRIVEENGGSIRVESALGAGSTFYFTIRD